jgi:predicted ATP-dependent endonuclease of OLD family
MITRIEAYRYRCFQKLALDVGPYQVLVGKNGAGKSTLLDLPVLLGEILSTRSLNLAFFEPTPSHPRPRADVPEELIYDHKDNWFSLAVEIQIPELISDTIHRNRVEIASKKQRTALERNEGRKYGKLRYELGLHIINDALEISQEHLFLLPNDAALLGGERNGLWGEFIEEDELETIRVLIERDSSGVAKLRGENKRSDKKGDLADSIRVPENTPALAGMPLDIRQYAATQWLVNHLTQGSQMYMPNLEKMRCAALPPGQNWRVRGDASTLAWSIMATRQQAPEEFEEWIDRLKDILPLLSDVDAKRREDDGLAYFRVSYGANRTVNASGLSDGTLSILAHTILPYLDNTAPLMTVEEPENGIHPKAIEEVLESLGSIPKSQVWVTTHSPIAVAATSLEYLLCLEQTRTEGVVVTLGTKHPRLAHWKGTPSLATLQTAGIL